MNTLVLVFHPHLHDGSRINRTLAETAAAAPSVTVRTIYSGGIGRMSVPVSVAPTMRPQ